MTFNGRVCVESTGPGEIQLSRGKRNRGSNDATRMPERGETGITVESLLRGSPIEEENRRRQRPSQHQDARLDGKGEGSVWQAGQGTVELELGSSGTS